MFLIMNNTLGLTGVTEVFVWMTVLNRCVWAVWHHPCSSG